MPRKKTPTALKLIKGTDRKDRANENEPECKVGLPVCPTWLNAEGKKEWKRAGKLLVESGVATHLDFVNFATFCQMWGEFVEGVKTGEPVSIAHITQMRLYAVELGMTPSSRSKVSAIEKDKKPTGWDTF
jgi:phage terminase small subunit